MKLLNQQILMLFFSLLVVDMASAFGIGSHKNSRHRGGTSGGEPAGPGSEATSSCKGLPGVPGRDGRDGRDAALCGELLKEQSAVSGAVYTRWGKIHCPSGATELYSGMMAGQWYNHYGGASNYLCLPYIPIYDRYTPGNQESGYIYGAQYRVEQQAGIFGQFENRKAPCAVCQAESRGSHVMIPARNICPSGWTTEYQGYLMSAHSRHHGRTEYICVDKIAEFIGSPVQRDGAMLYFVQGRCVNLPCPPYVDYKELSCVVCTK